MALQVLEIGPNIKPQAEAIFIGAEVTTLDALEELEPDIVGDARFLKKALKGRKFDVIFASHVMEHIPWGECDTVMAEWVECINEGGSLHLVVPSLEWAAKQILSEHPSKAVIPHLYAGVTNAYDIHVNGFTMRLLRAKMEKAGLAVARARTGEYTIIIRGTPMIAEQHYCAGYKVNGNRPPPQKE